MITLTKKYKPDFVVPPGETLREVLQNIGMSQTELALRTSRPIKTICEIINGVAVITPETSIQLERVLNIPASFWNNLQNNYQENLIWLQEKKRLEKEIYLIKDFPYNVVSNLDWIEKTKDNFKRVENILAYFGVDSLKLIPKVYPAAFRTHKGKSISSMSLAAWLRKGEIDCQKIETQPFNSNGIYKLFNLFKEYTSESPKTFIPKLQDDLAKNGVALVFTHDLPKTYVCGASRWITPNKAMIQLSLRGSYSDIMWFTLFHELAHILLHGKKEKFVDLQNNNNKDFDDEKEADNFAALNLIPKTELDKIISSNDFSPINIKSVATRLGIHPGIIIGRLHFEKALDFNKLNFMRIKYIWEN